MRNTTNISSEIDNLVKSISCLENIIKQEEDCYEKQPGVSYLNYLSCGKSARTRCRILKLKSELEIVRAEYRSLLLEMMAQIGFYN